MEKLFDDGVLEATLYPDRWVFCRWVQNEHGRLQKRLIKDLNYIEQVILASKLYGWFTDSEVEHTDFHKLLKKFGAVPGEVKGQYLRFMKLILKAEDLHKKAVN